MRLRISKGDECLGDFDLAEGEYVIGSCESAHLRIESDQVAPEHVRITIGPGGAEVEDLASGRETRISGLQLAGVQRLLAGSVLQVGDVEVRIFTEDPPASRNRSAAAAQRYLVGAVVASGAMGVIWRARETSTGREVAMKQMRRELEAVDEVLAARFVQEAKITAHLEHPNVVPVHDVSDGQDGERFYTMKLVRGVSLEEVLMLLRKGDTPAFATYPIEALLTIFQKVCDAVAFAHSRGVIHRDLKPANIMVGEYGEVLVMDWGLAKLVGEAAAALVIDNRVGFGQTGSGVTMAGAIMGTPHYMAPEQASGDTEFVDERSDVYALGAILYEILALRTPVEGRTVREVLGKVREGAVTPPIERVGAEALPHLPGGRIPASLAAVAMKALALSPERRYQRVPELQAEIRAYQNGFATGAEEAGAARQFTLLLQRHRGVSTAIAASLLLLVAISAWYITSLVQARNLAVASETRATQNEKIATTNAAVAKKAQLEAEASARREAEQAERANANAELLKVQVAVARAAEEKAKTALEAERLAQGKAVLAEQGEAMAKQGEAMAVTTAKTEKEKAAEAERKLSKENAQRIAALPAATDAAAVRGDAGAVLINSVFLLGRESDPEQKELLQRRIGAALRQMPRLLFLRAGARLARISPDGSRGVFFEGNKGLLFDPASQSQIGLPLNLGMKGTAAAVEFGADSRFLLGVGSADSTQPQTDPLHRDLWAIPSTVATKPPIAGQPKVWIWDTTTGGEQRMPPFRLEGVLERVLPFPDRLRFVTIHAIPKSTTKELNLWMLDGKSPVAQWKKPGIGGIVSSLIPSVRSTPFFLQSFTPGPEDRTGFIHQVDVSSTTLRVSDPLRDSVLAPAAAIRADGQRAVRLVNRQLRLAEAPPPDASGRIIGAQVLTYQRGTSAAGVPLQSLEGELQELIDGTTGKAIGKTLTGGVSTFSPDLKWLLMAAGKQARLHDALSNDAGLERTLDLPGKALALAFSADSSRAVVTTEDRHISLWSTKNGRRACPDICLSSEPTDISLSHSSRFVFVSGECVSLWDVAPPSLRPQIMFPHLSSYGVWVSGDGRRAVGIPPGPPEFLDNGAMVPVVTTPPARFGSNLSLTLHKLDGGSLDGRVFTRRTEIPPGGTCWLTRNGRFFLVWGGTGGGGAKIWNLEKNGSQPRDIFTIDPKQRNRRPKFERFYNGPGVIVVESRTDNTLALAVEGVRPDALISRGLPPEDRDQRSALFFDGETGKLLPGQGSLSGSIGIDSTGRQFVADADGQASVQIAKNRLRRELPADARRAFFSDDGKLVAVLCTSATEEAIVKPVLSSLLIDSDRLGKTPGELERDGRHYGFTPPAGRAWRLYVYDVATGGAILGGMTLPALAAFRWEGSRCVALSSDGQWTEIDLSPDLRDLADLHDAALVLTGRAIDTATGRVTPHTKPAAEVVRIWQRLQQAHPGGWQTGAK